MNSANTLSPGTPLVLKKDCFVDKIGHFPAGTRGRVGRHSSHNSSEVCFVPDDNSELWFFVRLGAEVSFDRAEAILA